MRQFIFPALIGIMSLVLIPSTTSSLAYTDEEYPAITSSGYFDSEGRHNVIGLVKNSRDVPVQVVLELSLKDANGDSVVIEESAFSRVIYPSTESPFKFILPQGYTAEGVPRMAAVAEVPLPNFTDVLVLNYTNMAVGESRALVGTVENTSPFEIHDVAIYASVHDKEYNQIDSVKTESIPVLKPGEVRGFTVAPDPAIRADVLYYSCAGLDYDDPITTLKTGDGQFIAYNLASVAKVSSFRYVDENDSISFGIQHYNPAGGPLTMRIPQTGENHTITVLMDGQLYEDVKTEMDGKTVTIDFFVPKGEHQVSIQGVRNVPEFPMVVAGLAAMIGAIVFIARFANRDKSSI